MDIIDEANKAARKGFQKRFCIEKLKAKIRTKVDDVVHWTVENADLIVTVTPFVYYGVRTAAGFARNVHRSANLRKEKDLKELYCYDRSLGHYWELRRKLSNREWTEIDKRRRSGEKLGDILKGLNVLK